MRRPWRIVIIGSGPRGLMVAERLAARLGQRPPDRPVHIRLIDDVEVGCGRIFRTDQPDWFLMNTTPGQISMFSGAPDDGPPRAGAGPSLAQWWSTVDPSGYPGHGGYAPRAWYGRYLHFVLNAVERGLPAGVRLCRTRGSVTDLEPALDGYRLTLAGDSHLRADRVVLTTGHVRPRAEGARSELAEFAAGHPELVYLRGDSPAEMPLDTIPAQATVGVLGLGLSFYDVMIALTEGRGGRFTPTPAGTLTYRPSGAEPALVAGSRSGLPLAAKSENRKPPGSGHTPTLFTVERVRRRPALDFADDVLPWLLAEVELAYYATAVRRSRGEHMVQAFNDEVHDSAADKPPDVRSIAARHGADLPPLDLEALARPFARRTFARPEEFDQALAAVLLDGVREAERGNVDSPLMAALDVIRDTRGVMCAVVDFGGLRPAAHREDFLGSYVPIDAALVAGPPAIRVRQLLALMDAGLLRVVGPEVQVAGEEKLGRFTIGSPSVTGSWTPVDVVVDARMPKPGLDADPAPLTRNLRSRGLWTEFVNLHGDEAFPTGGVAVTRAPFHPVRHDGTPEEGLYVLGVPCENTRWFTQVGSGRPGRWTSFIRDADAIAEHALDPAVNDKTAARPDSCTALTTAE